MMKAFLVFTAIIGLSFAQEPRNSQYPLATVPECAYQDLTRLTTNWCGEEGKWNCVCQQYASPYNALWFDLKSACNKDAPHVLYSICEYGDRQQPVLPLDVPVPLTRAFFSKHPGCLKLDFSPISDFISLPDNVLPWNECPEPEYFPHQGPKGHSGLSTAAKAGIGGGIAGATVLVLFVTFCRWRVGKKVASGTFSSATHAPPAMLQSNHSGGSASPATGVGHARSLEDKEASVAVEDKKVSPPAYDV